MKNTSKFQNVVIVTIVGWLVLFVFLPNLMIIGTSFLTRDDVPGALRDGLGSQAETCIRPAEDGRWHVDLKGANALWLRRAGLSPEHIALCPDCTACRTDRFWSHRVMGERRGSMAAIIQLL